MEQETICYIKLCLCYGKWSDMEHISKLSFMMVILYKCIENNINWLTEQEVICYIKLSLGSDEKPIIKLSSTMSS